MSEHRARRARRLNSHINVVPYIDVMLVLLVIFMVTAPLMAPSVVDLPQVSQASSHPALAIEVLVQKEGALHLIDRDPSRALEQDTTLQALPALTRSRMQTNEDRPVVITADKSVMYERVLNVMDALKTAGIARVGLSVVSKSAP
jgi:biopolymer transport protein TolR